MLEDLQGGDAKLFVKAAKALVALLKQGSKPGRCVYLVQRRLTLDLCGHDRAKDGKVGLLPTDVFQLSRSIWAHNTSTTSITWAGSMKLSSRVTASTVARPKTYSRLKARMTPGERWYRSHGGEDAQQHDS